jgi:uncharacterized protein (TIGR00730 family)
MIRRLCVYCASNDGNRPIYKETARSFGKLLASKGIALVYGGGRAGMMGALADGALEVGGEVIGVMPHGLVQREVAHTGLTRLEIVDTMHERKARMASLADGFVALPGGLGTLEEFFETWTWAQLGVHAQPVALLDVEGFWSPLVRLMDHVQTEGFLRGAAREFVLVDDDMDRLLERLVSFTPVATRKWLRPGET